MSKKNLNEVRRFMKLANLSPSITSNFVKGLNEMGDVVYGRNDVMGEEEEEEVEEVPDIGALEDEEAGLEDELGGLEDEEAGVEDELAGLEAEEGGEAEDLVLNIVSDIQQLASLAGVEVDVEGGEEEVGFEGGEEEVEFDVEEPGLDAEVDIEAEETLEEMIDAILREEDEEVIEEEEEEVVETQRGRARKGKPPGARLAYDDTKNESRKRRAKPRKESIKVVDDDRIVQEVAARVKKRLARIIARNRKQR